MDRRRFCLGVPLAAVAPRAFAQAPAPPRPLRVGLLSSGGSNAALQGPAPASSSARALVQGMRDLGYRYGIDFVIEGRGGGGRPDRYPALAVELVDANVDVIVAAGPTVRAVKRATLRIPIVMVGGATDPVEEKLVASLAAPGGNITGLTLQQADLVGKRLELLKQVAPGPAPIGVLWEETSAGSWRAAQAAAAARKWQLLSYDIRDPAAIGPACAAARAAGAGSLLVASGAVLFQSVPQMVQAAATHRLPAISALRVFSEEGGLMSYAADLNDLYRRAATFVDRIAKGASPATMPMEQPTKFDLVVNLRTAAALGIVVPQAVLVRADQVIS